MPGPVWFFGGSPVPSVDKIQNGAGAQTAEFSNKLQPCIHQVLSPEVQHRSYLCLRFQCLLLLTEISPLKPTSHSLQESVCVCVCVSGEYPSPPPPPPPAVSQVVDSLDVSTHGTRVGLVQYSSRVRTEFPLNMYHSADEIKAAVMKVEYMEKGTMTGLALKHMLENSFSEAEGARPASRNIPRIGLVFTDGRSQDDITEFAKMPKEAGITMYAVGVGKAVEDELREIASEPVEKHFYYTTDFTAISTIAENLKLNVCPEESQGEIEVKDPCACESLVEFQQATMSSLEQLTQKLAGMTARLEQLENQLLTRK
ncbi:matrilin-4-like [Hippoglossus stenolepis]|uniref:matrilin-4-like n=1 Tax=Hippoglossus stenolepis TaxID=195615 RepID=UPI001FAEBCDE|nr:matrilin-4-like [Hippoglossus stenolepis]